MSSAEGPTETLSPALPTEIEHTTKGLLQAACDRGLTLATAESCTGGLLASLLTDVEGCSHAFERGFIVYTEEAKGEMLGVARELIEEKGVVSEEVARAMAEGAITNSRADIALAVTGFAGKGDEPGLVHFACARRDGPTAHHEAHFGDMGRGPIRVECLRVALRMMQDALA